MDATTHIESSSGKTSNNPPVPVALAPLAGFLIEQLGIPDAIRVLPRYIESTGYIDIETTGLEPEDRITSVALWARGRARCYVRGINLSELRGALEGLSLLVTFNGTTFDLPRLREEFRIALMVPHIDLRTYLAALGHRGGLKRCERSMGIHLQLTERGNGEEAVVLWSRYERGDHGALLELLRYNLQDTLSLELLAAEVYSRVIQSSPSPARFFCPPHPDLSSLGFSELLV